MWRSVPQMDAILTLTRTSEGPNFGMGTSRISVPGAGAGLTTAIMVFDIKDDSSILLSILCQSRSKARLQRSQEWNPAVGTQLNERRATGKRTSVPRIKQWGIATFYSVPSSNSQR